MAPRKPDLKRLKVHLVRGCNSSFHGPVGADGYRTSVPVPEAHHVKWGNPDTDYWCWDAVPRVTDDVREVTCGYCKTKLTNELWFKDWSRLTDQELALLRVLRERRDQRKARGEEDIDAQR